MKVKNCTQTITVGVTALLTTASQINQDIFAKMKAFKEASEENKASAKTELLSSLPKELKKEIEALGCETPLDTVDMSLSLSGFFFDIYMSGLTVPAAPLARKIFEKQVLDLADKLKDPEEFDFDGRFKDVVQEVMMDDKKWESTKVYVDVPVGSEKLSIGLSYKAADLFPEVLAVATTLFMELESAKSQTASEAF